MDLEIATLFARLRGSLRRQRRAHARTCAMFQQAVAVPVLLAACGVAAAQTVEDEFMLSKRELLTGLSYSYDEWDEYWEGTLKRRNGNIGTITTRTATWNASYGLTDRLTLIAAIPYVWTRASQGVLSEMKDFQDLTLAAKLRLFELPFTGEGSLRAMAVISGGMPLSGYTPDFQPLSVGSASDRISGRLTLHFGSRRGWFLNGTSAYTHRENVRLDRSAYFTDGRLFLTNEVEMPAVFDYTVGGGYARGSVMGSLSFTQQRMQDGGDIRRQDMPFVSNRMNFSRVGAMLSYSPPQLRGLELRLGYGYVVDGRNVGQSTTVTTGLNYRFDFDGRDAR